MDGLGSKGMNGYLRNSLTNNPSSHRQSRMVGKSHVHSSNIDKAPTIDHSLRNSGALRNLSLANKNNSMVNAGTYPSSTKDNGRQGAGTSLVHNLN